MHETLKALFAERAQPTHATAEAVRAELATVMATAAKVNQQMATYRGLHLSARFANDHPALRGKIERIKQTLNAAQQATTAFIQSAEHLEDTVAQMERYLAEDEQDVLQFEAREAEAGAKATTE